MEVVDVVLPEYSDDKATREDVVDNHESKAIEAISRFDCFPKQVPLTSDFFLIIFKFEVDIIFEIYK